jgi:heme exporter protein B
MSRALLAILAAILACCCAAAGRAAAWRCRSCSFLAAAIIVPFAVGPDPALLARIGGGVIWVAALLAAILPLDRLIEPDREAGLFDQWAARAGGRGGDRGAHPGALAQLCARRCWPACPRRCWMRAPSAWWNWPAGGTPGLAAVTVAAITAGLKGAALAALLVIPLCVPVLIFGAGALAIGGGSGLALCAAASLVLVALAPLRRQRPCARRADAALTSPSLMAALTA